MTITLTRKEAQQVLDAMISKQCGGCYESSICCWEDVREAIETLRSRLAEPEPEPVAYGFQNTAVTGRNRWLMLREEVPTDDQYDGQLWTPLYASPPQRIDAEPLAWLYAEGLEALQAGKCWTAYGTRQDDDCCIPVYITPPAILTIL